MDWLYGKKLSSFFIIIIVAISVFLTIPPLVFRCGFTVKRHHPDLRLNKEIQIQIETMRRRILSGPGSSPPRCGWKCGKCTPCKPTHVSVPPEMSVTTEYYPEAWRCKCGNKLYMP